MELDYSDYVTFTIIRVKDEDGPTHWEMEFKDSNDEVTSFGTSPDFAGVYNMVLECIVEIDDNTWIDFDANKDKK